MTTPVEVLKDAYEDACIMLAATITMMAKGHPFNPCGKNNTGGCEADVIKCKKCLLDGFVHEIMNPAPADGEE